MFLKSLLNGRLTRRIQGIFRVIRNIMVVRCNCNASRRIHKDIRCLPAKRLKDIFKPLDDSNPSI